MQEIHYVISEDNSTNPATYYPEVVVSGEVDDVAIGELIHDLEPNITAALATTVLRTFGFIAEFLVRNGYWIVIDDFLQVYADFPDDYFIYYYTDELDYEECQVLLDAQNAFEADTEAVTTFVRDGYTFPKTPHVDSSYETKYNIADHLSAGYGLVINGSDFAISRTDLATGVWLKSPAGNNYRQNRISYISETMLIITPDLTGELGPAGLNSVEHELFVRSRYDAFSGSVVGIYERKLRAMNPLDWGHSEAFLTGSQTGGVLSTVFHTFQQGEQAAIKCLVDGTDLLISCTFNGTEYSPITVTADAIIAIPAIGDRFFEAFCSYSLMKANAEANGGSLSEVVELNMPPVSVTELSSGTPSAGVTGNGWYAAFKIDVVDAASLLSVELATTAHMAMMVRKDIMPSWNFLDCYREYTGGVPTPPGACEISSPEAGTYYFLAYGFESGSFSITATLS